MDLKDNHTENLQLLENYQIEWETIFHKLLKKSGCVSTTTNSYSSEKPFTKGNLLHYEEQKIFK